VYPVVEGIPFFGVSANGAELKWQELESEINWIVKENDLQEHLDFAKQSAVVGRRLIERVTNGSLSEAENKPLALDLGAGGCLQSWQLAQFGFDVVAVELVPEFLLAAPPLPESIDRVCSDVELLPFKDQSFDVIFCKETLHHVGDLGLALREACRVCKIGGAIVIEEPAWPSNAKSNMAQFKEHDHAAHVGITHAYHNYGEYRATLDRYCKVSYEEVSPAKDYLERQLEWFGEHSRKLPTAAKRLFGAARPAYRTLRNSAFVRYQTNKRGGGFVLITRLTRAPEKLPDSGVRDVLPIDPARIEHNSGMIDVMSGYNQELMRVFEQDWSEAGR
jgi:SAM-dependent methyltransferase